MKNQYFREDGFCVVEELNSMQIVKENKIVENEKPIFPQIREGGIPENFY